MARTNKGNFISRTPKVHLKRKLLSWALGVTIVIVCVGCIYAIFFSSLLTVTSLEVQGNKLVSEEKIIQLVEQTMRSNRWRSMIVSPGHVLFWITTNEISGMSMGEPTVRSVAIKSNLISRKVVIQVREREFVGTWCTDSCVGFDASGIAYFSAPHVEGTLLLHVQDENIRPLPLGESVWKDEKAFNNVLETIYEVRGSGIAIASITIKDYALREWEIRPAKGGVIYLSVDFVPEKIGAIIASVLEKTTWDTLQYIDLRVQNRVYFK